MILAWASPFNPLETLTSVSSSLIEMPIEVIVPQIQIIDVK